MKQKQGMIGENRTKWIDINDIVCFILKQQADAERIRNYGEITDHCR